MGRDTGSSRSGSPASVYSVAYVSGGKPNHVICSGLTAAGLGIYKWRANPACVSPTKLASPRHRQPEAPRCPKPPPEPTPRPTPLPAPTPRPTLCFRRPPLRPARARCHPNTNSPAFGTSGSGFWCAPSSSRASPASVQGLAEGSLLMREQLACPDCGPRAPHCPSLYDFADWMVAHARSAQSDFTVITEASGTSQSNLVTTRPKYPSGSPTPSVFPEQESRYVSTWLICPSVTPILPPPPR